MQKIQQAVVFLKQGQPKQALQILKQLKVEKSKDPNVLNLLANCHLANQNLSLAQKFIDKALNRTPRDSTILTTQLNIQLQLKNWPLAESTATKILKTEQKNPDILFKLGVIKYKLKDFECAKDMFQNILNLLPNHDRALVYLGLISNEKLKFRQAIEYFDKALKINPNSAEALQSKGIALKELREREQALESLKKADLLRPNNPIILHNLASTYAMFDEKVHALNYYSRALKLEPLNPFHHHWLNLFLWREKSDDFLMSYQHVLSQTPNAHHLRREFAFKLFQSKEYDQALEQCDFLVKREPHQARNFKLRGDIYRSLRRFENAISDHTKAVKLDNSSYPMKEALATSYLSVGEAEEALKLLNKLIQFDNLHQGYWALKATALRILGHDDYHELYDYDNLVLQQQIEIPKGFESLSDFNAELEKTLRTYHDTNSHPLDQSLQNGTQSTGDLFSEEKQIIQQLKIQLTDLMNDFLSRLPDRPDHPVISRYKKGFDYSGSWSVLLNSQGFHTNHFHSLGWFSGPYYVSLPKEINDESQKQGWIKLGEPGFESVLELPAEKLIKPKEGMLVRFPSYMWHGTTPFLSNEDRLIVASDLLPSR